MKLPPWLAGLLMVLVLAALWWALSGTPEDEPAQSSHPTETTQARPEQPSEQSVAVDPGGAGGSSAADESTSADETFARPAQDGASDEAPGGRADGAGDEAPDGRADQPGDDPVPMGIDTRDWDDIDACNDDDLPATMIPVIEDIWAGGPYDHPEHDAGRFANYEGFLPDERSGYYREFTVETPGLDHRGARRIVTGGEQEHDPDVWYFTADHYESFCEFAP